MIESVSGFEWDHGNLDHCSKHGVSRSDVDDVFKGAPTVLADLAHPRSEERFQAIGTAGGERAIFVVFTIRVRDGRRMIRPISARYMHREEIKSDETENPDVHDR